MTAPSQQAKIPGFQSRPAVNEDEYFWYDSLPREVRETLQGCVFKWSCRNLYLSHLKGHSAAAISEAIERCDARALVIWQETQQAKDFLNKLPGLKLKRSHS